MCIRSFIIWYFTDVCVWRLWLHYSGTRSALPSFERQPPFQSGTPQVLWQEAFQVLKCKLCQHAASGQFLKKQKKNYETNKTKTKQGTNPGILLNSAPRGHNIDNKVEYGCEVFTLESVIDVGQGISVGPGKFDKKNKRRALNTHLVWPNFCCTLSHIFQGLPFG